MQQNLRVSDLCLECQSGHTEEEALRHVSFIMEYLWSEVDPRPSPHGRMLRVLDMHGFGLGDIGGPAFNFIKKVRSWYCVAKTIWHSKLKSPK